MGTTLAKHENGFVTELKRTPPVCHFLRQCGYVAIDLQDGFGWRSITGISVDLGMHETEYMEDF